MKWNFLSRVALLTANFSSHVDKTPPEYIFPEEFTCNSGPMCCFDSFVDASRRGTLIRAGCFCDLAVALSSLPNRELNNIAEPVPARVQDSFSKLLISYHPFYIIILAVTKAKYINWSPNEIEDVKIVG